MIIRDKSLSMCGGAAVAPEWRRGRLRAGEDMTVGRTT